MDLPTARQTVGTVLLQALTPRQSAMSRRRAVQLVAVDRLPFAPDTGIGEPDGSVPIRWRASVRVTLLRAALIPATLILFVLVGGFLAQVPWATGLWPWPAEPLSYIFIASILAAIAVPVLWIALTGEAAAIRAGALDLTVMYGGMFVYVLTLIGNPHEPRLWPYALAFGLAAAGSAGAFLLARPVPWDDPRSMPQPVRLSFGAFAMVLTGAGVALLVHAGIFPWQLGPETSVMFGLVFLSAATYFTYGALDPHWGNAVGQLAGFLAYDLVLLAPYLEHFNTAHGGPLVSLVIYVAFLVYSGALASYYLFASNATRIRLALVGSESLSAISEVSWECQQEG
jgi:hypothetical protein